jgi:hypothetical protein
MATARGPLSRRSRRCAQQRAAFQQHPPKTAARPWRCPHLKPRWPILFTLFSRLDTLLRGFAALLGRLGLSCAEPLLDA